MKINEVAKITGLTPKTIRFYEQRGIISAPARKENGYREYATKHLDELFMIKRSRLVGFSLEDCKDLLEISANPQRKSADVKQKALKKLNEIDEQIKELQEMKDILTALTKACPGDDNAPCPIIDALSCKKNAKC